MVKYICTVCGYVHEGETPPEFCVQCKAPEFKFKIMDQHGRTLADEHRIGIVDGIDPEVIDGLRKEYTAECTEVGMYMAMARQAEREGFSEIADAYRKIAMEGAEHAGKLAEILGDILFADTKKNLEIRADAEFVSCEDKKRLATRAKQLNLDAIHDTVHEMCKDDARHYRIFSGLRERYFD